MGKLVNGLWQTSSITQNDSQGHFVRPNSSFRSWITQDGRSGFKAEPGRYHVYISYACPWASRVLIFLVLKKLQDCISFSTVEPIMNENGWGFGEKSHFTHDPLHGARYLYEIYQLADPRYTGKVTVPVLWDTLTHTIVNNESSEIIRMLNAEFNNFTSHQYDWYPYELRVKIDQLNDYIYANINNGVYQRGFASSQAAYEEAVDKLFAALDQVEMLLQTRRYLLGNHLTEADWRLFTTLIRFDCVYYGHFKCNLKQVEDYSHLSNYVRELYQIPGVEQTVNFEHIKKHYYLSHAFLNPSGIVPKGPAIDYSKKHNRQTIAL